MKVLSPAVLLVIVCCTGFGAGPGNEDAKFPDDGTMDAVVSGDLGCDLQADPERDVNSDPGGIADPGEAHDVFTADILPFGCCTSDADCSAVQRCVGVSDGVLGACVRREWMTGYPPIPCWSDADCSGGLPCRHADPPTCAKPAWHQPGGCLAEGCCMEDGDCDAGFRCESMCKPIPPSGRCRYPEDCDISREFCDGAEPCICPAEGPWCQECSAICEDRVGNCVDLVNAGCCALSDGCQGTARERCLYVVGSPYPTWNVCVEKAAKGRCWIDQDCLTGQTCQGAAVCPCGVDCGLKWSGPGLCLQPGATCVAVPVIDAPACESGATVRFDGQGCVTCDGACEVGPFCDLAFADQTSCLVACHPGMRCEPWGGECSAVQGEPTWWNFDGVGCQPGAGCGAPEGLGVYDSAAACDAACGTAALQFDAKTSGGFFGYGFGRLTLEGRTLTLIPVEESAAICSRTLDVAEYRALFEKFRTVDWAAVLPEYVPPENPSCCCDDTSMILRVVFGGGGGPPVLAETWWCGHALGYGSLPPALPPELISLSQWLTKSIANRTPCSADTPLL